MKWRDLLVGHHDTFPLLLSRQLEQTAVMVDYVDRYIHTPSPVTRQHLAIMAGDQEHLADDVRHELMIQLSQTFVTPFDREDINALSRAIDDITDYAENTIKEIRLYRIDPDEFIYHMVANLKDAVMALAEAVSSLTHDEDTSHHHVLVAKKAENQMEYLYRHAIANFNANTPVPYMIKMREIYRHLSNAADRVDTAANVIDTILVKQNN